MNFAQVFGDDEHTASDGVYFRLLKARKWLYLASIVASLHAIGGLNYSALSSLTGGLVHIGGAAAWVGIVLGLGTLLIQYGLLLAQGYVAYPSLVRERLSKSSAESFAKLEQERQAALAQIEERKRVIRDTERETELQRLNLAIVDADEAGLDAIRSIRGRGSLVDERIEAIGHLSLEERYELRRSAEDWIKNHGKVMNGRIAELRSSEQMEERVSANYHALLKSTPERQILYRRAEYALDFFRFAPPLALALGAMGSLMASSPFCLGPCR